MSTEISLPGDFSQIVEGVLAGALSQALRDFIREDIPKIAEEQEKAINDRMATLKSGEDFYGFLVEDDSDATHLTLVRTLENAPVSYPLFDAFPPTLKKIKGLKIDLLRGALKIERHVNLTDSRRAVIDVTEVVEVTIEVEIDQKAYTIRVGGGFDKLRKDLEQYLVQVDLKAPPLRFHGLLAKSGGGGFVIYVHSGLPVPIPLGTSCFALTGVGLLYGERFAPWVSGNKPADSVSAMAALGNAKAEDYVSWARRRDLDRWVPVEPDLRIFGLDADVGDVLTAGQIVELHESGLTYLSYGPTLVFGGHLNVLETPIVDVMGAIDLPSKSMFLSLSTSSLKVCSLVEIAGSIALSASLEEQTRTWVAVGGYEMKGCSVNILDGLLLLTGGYRVVPFQGAAVRAAARVEAEGTVLGLGGGYSFSVALTGTVGWNPIEVGGQLDVGGSIWVTVWGTKLGAGIDAHILIQIAQPLKLRLWGEVTMDLPWPLSPVKFGVEVFNYDKPIVASPLPGFALAGDAPLPFFYAPSGLQGQLGVTRSDVWPDVAFELPFRRSASGPAHIVNRVADDGAVNESGVTTTHEITTLAIMRVDEISGAELDVPNVCAAWLGTSTGEGTARTSRLAIPSNDPLGWLQSYDHSQPSSAEPVERVVLQTFGAGADEVFPSTATLTVEWLRAVSPAGIRLANLPWTSPYARTLTTRIVLFDVGMEVLGAWVTFAVRRYDIRCVSRTQPNLRADGVFIKPTKVRDVDSGFAEWSLVVERTAADRRKSVQIDGGGETPIAISAVAYTLDATEYSTGGTQTVLQPGIYRLHLKGRSEARYSTSYAPFVWTEFVREFRVVPPDKLRLYMRYATFGDERIFELSHRGWNPNPSGRGFGHYPGYKGIVRSKVGYLSRIYDRLWVAAKRGDKPAEVRVTQCEDGSLAGGKLGAAWPSLTGAALILEEELQFDLPNASGEYDMEIYRSNTNDGNNLFKVDAWSYRVSSFASPSAHLKPDTNVLTCAIGPFGTRDLNERPLADLPAGFDFAAVPDALPKPGWALPNWMCDEPDFDDPNLGLTFLHLVDWSGFFDAEVERPSERITSRPAKPTTNLLMDSTSRPLGLLLRTAEPVDWRRVDACFVQGDATYDRRFGVRVFPSPDGCSAILLALAGRLPVRLPTGQFGVRIVFHYRLGKLPILVSVALPLDVTETFTFTFSQVLGRSWP